MLNFSGWPRKLGSPLNWDSQKWSKMRHIVKFRPRGTPYGKSGKSLILWVIGIRLKEAYSEASRCRDTNFYRKKHRCFKSLATLTYQYSNGLLFKIILAPRLKRRHFPFQHSNLISWRPPFFGIHLISFTPKVKLNNLINDWMHYQEDCSPQTESTYLETSSLGDDLLWNICFIHHQKSYIWTHQWL